MVAGNGTGRLYLGSVAFTMNVPDAESKAFRMRITVKTIVGLNIWKFRSRVFWIQEIFVL